MTKGSEWTKKVRNTLSQPPTNPRCWLRCFYFSHRLVERYARSYRDSPSKEVEVRHYSSKTCLTPAHWIFLQIRSCGRRLLRLRWQRE